MTPAQLRKAGFALLGMSSTSSATPLKEMCECITRLSSYEIRELSGTYWIRPSLYRGGHELPEPFERCVTSSAAFDKKVFNNAAVRHAATGYSRFRDDSLPVTSIDVAVQTLEEAGPVATPEAWRRLSECSMLLPPAAFRRFLTEHGIPKCFSWFPNAQISGYLFNFDFDGFLAIARNLRFTSEYDFRDICNANELPSSLNNWQIVDSFGLFRCVANWASVLFFPKIVAGTFGQWGLSFVVSDDSFAEAELPRFPDGWIRLMRSPASFGVSVDEMPFGKPSIDKFRYVYRRYCWVDATTESRTFLNWVLERLSKILQAMADVRSYERDAPNGPAVPLDLPQEFLLTFDRIARRTLQLQAADSDWSVEGSVFEVADLWSEMHAVWHAPGVSTAPAAFRTRLFSIGASSAKLRTILSAIPSPWDSRFVATSEIVHNDVLESIKKSVWSSRVKRAEGVRINQTPGINDVEDWDLFSAKLLTDLRNTQHGYLQKKDNVKRRLLLSDGAISTSLSFLPSLWMLAFLTDPHSFLGWPNRPPLGH
jgi:hypothetical protein